MPTNRRRVPCLDDSGNVVDESVTTGMVIWECAADGRLIQETFGFVRHDDDYEDDWYYEGDWDSGVINDAEV